MPAQLSIRRGYPRTVRHRRPRTITRGQETAFAVVIAVIGFLLTVLIVTHLDDLRFAFAEWGDASATVVTEPEN